VHARGGPGNLVDNKSEGLATPYSPVYTCRDCMDYVINTVGKEHIGSARLGRSGKLGMIRSQQIGSGDGDRASIPCATTCAALKASSDKGTLHKCLLYPLQYHCKLPHCMSLPVPPFVVLATSLCLLSHAPMSGSSHVIFYLTLVVYQLLV
jgi:hypothetical protein